MKPDIKIGDLVFYTWPVRNLGKVVGVSDVDNISLSIPLENTIDNPRIGWNGGVCIWRKEIRMGQWFKNTEIELATEGEAMLWQLENL